MNPAREEILGNVRMALLRRIGASVPPVSPSARVGPRVPGDVNSEIELLLSEIGKLGGATRRIGIHQVQTTLGELAKAEYVKKATLWDTPEIKELNMAKILKGLGVEIVSPQSDKYHLAGCDLGVTGPSRTADIELTLTIGVHGPEALHVWALDT